MQFHSPVVGGGARSGSVALIDWNWAGHHPTYFTHFALAMAEAGVDVVPFCTQPQDFACKVCSALGSAARHPRIGEAQIIGYPERSNFRPARWRGIYEGRKFFGGLGKQLRAWERQNRRKIDLVFFACIYDWEFHWFHAAERLFGFPWSGLYIHARALRLPGSPLPYRDLVPRPERLFGGRLLRSVALLDEGAQNRMREISERAQVVTFPDITDATLPAAGGSGWGLADKLKRFAAGRPIVSLLGYLQQTKGVEEFLRLSADPRMQEVVFFLGGEAGLDGFDNETLARLRRELEQAPNVLAHLQKLPEATMNSLISVSDVVFAAYRNFPNSSNVLTKAAIFERPVVVSDGFLMAERVRHYALGEVVVEGDAEDLVTSVLRMLHPEYSREMKRRARWADYREAHSKSRLGAAMKLLLAASVPRAPAD